MANTKNRISDLRDHLFEALEALKDTDKPLDEEIKRAQAVCLVSKQIIESARVEVNYAKNIGALPSGEFFDDRPKQPQLGPGKPPNGKAASA